MSRYISFHNHDTVGSLLDSSLKVKDLVKWAVANNMNAVGTQNHGSMASCLNLYKECKSAGIKAILGFEAYVTENKLDEKGNKIRDNHHICLIAKNLTGWHNLIKLHNLSWGEKRYYYDPRITLEDLFEYKEGLIVTTACLVGVVAKPFTNGDTKKAEKILSLLQDNFGDDLYLELQEHNSFEKKDRDRQTNYNKWLIKESKQRGIKCIIQQDAHYYLPEHWEAHQVLLCKNTGSKLSKPVFKFDSHEYYCKNEAEMLEAFAQYPLQLVEQCFDNTSEIANKVEEFDITNKVYDCPVFGTPEETWGKLVKLTYEGLHKRFTQEFLNEHPEYIERIEYELGVVKQLKFVDYFLMLVDLYKFTNSNGIYMGIARGSAGGSLVLYSLGIIDVEPVRYNLLFERFLHDQRKSQPDYDGDTSDRDRPKVVAYIKKRYGENHVCNIGTYGELTAKAVFKAVASILEIPFSKANGLSSIMDSNLTLEENFKQIDTFRCACQNDDEIMRAYKIALVLEGTYSQRGIHACGLLISSKPLDDVCPCATVKDPKTGKRIVVTSNEMKEVDGDLKLLKLDVLSLSNLSIVQDADQLIYERHGIKLNFKNLDIKDEKTYKMLSDGYTLGVFQFNSPLMQRILKRVNPQSIEDLACVTSIARPGCLDSGLAESFIKRRNGQKKITPILKDTEKYMEDSLQLPIYQENCMQLSRIMAGFNGAEADTLRKCIGKKDPEKLKSEREHFVNGAINLGHTKERANEIFDIIEKFGGYGFNKCLDEDMYIEEYNCTVKDIVDQLKNKNKVNLCSYNTDSNTFFNDECINYYDSGIQDVYEYELTNGKTIRCTENHKFLCTDNKYYTINKIEEKDLVFKGIVTIKSKKYLGKKQTYNLEMKSKFHNYIINGVVSKNSHAVGYALLSYATAYYKANYTIEYMTALLNSVTDDLDKLNLYIGECYRLGINIVPPDINESKKDFAINTKGDIVFGFQGVKGLGNSAITSILNARKNGAFTSLTDFIQRANKVDKSNIQTLLKVGAFNSLEKNSKRWVNMLDYLQDAKNNKFYTEYDNLPRAIYTVVGTKQGKKSEKYQELVELKRELGGSKKDIEQKRIYTEKQEKIIDIYIESAEKHFLQYTVFSPKERMEFEQELLGFNISINPYKRWNDFKKFFVSKQGNTTIPYIELNELMNNGSKYFNLAKFHTVGILSDIKEIKTKKGNRMAKLTVEYFGVKTLVTVFANKYENDLEFKLQKGNMVSIVGKLVEANKQFTDEDYEIRLDTIRQLNVLINEYNKCVIPLDNKDREKVDYTVKTFTSQERQENLPIEKCVMYKINGKYMILNGLCWVNNAEKLVNNL